MNPSQNIITELLTIGLKKYNQSELARKMKVSRAYISALKLRPSNATLETLVRLAEVCGCKLQLLLKETESPETWRSLEL